MCLDSLHFFVFSSTTCQPAHFTGLEYLDMVAPLPQSKQEAIKQPLDEKIIYIKIAKEKGIFFQAVKDYSMNLKYHNIILLFSVYMKS